VAFRARADEGDEGGGTERDEKARADEDGTRADSPGEQ
jgi:hypothetical protein